MAAGRGIEPRPVDRAAAAVADAERARLGRALGLPLGLVRGVWGASLDSA